jgi:hypothetical protein
MTLGMSKGLLQLYISETVIKVINMTHVEELDNLIQFPYLLLDSCAKVCVRKWYFISMISKRI